MQCNLSQILPIVPWPAAYFGADVIKVEPPGKGDALRSLRMLENGTSGNSLWWVVGSMY